MDLKHDWKALNEVLFYNPTAVAGASSLVLLEDGDKVLDGVVSNGRAFTDLGIEQISSHKEKLDGLAAKYGIDQTIVFSKKSLDQYVIEAASLGTNYFQQLQSLRTKVLDQVDKKKNGAIISRRHFVLDLFGQKLRRLLPRRFNALVFIDERMGASFSYRAILLSYSGGQLDQFFEPDFSSLHENRLLNWQTESAAIGQYLETRYMMPCYGIFMSKAEWDDCLNAAMGKRKPWGQFVKYHDQGRAAVYPAGMTTKALLAVQRLMVYFSRL